MSLRLDLGICDLSSHAGGGDVAEAIAEAIPAVFSEASGEDIELEPRIVDAADLDIARREDRSSDDLHDALEQITGNQRGQDRVTSIGILLAGRYRSREDWFGVMFDDRFAPNSSEIALMTPREGCALFLDAIAGARAPQEFLAECVYTAIHELAHVFNLQHTKAPSYTAISAARDHPFELETRGFHKAEKDMLGACSSDRHVWPGGSAFGDLGKFKSTINPLDTNANAGEPLRLRIHIGREAFHSFEPLELDVELALAPGTGKKPQSVPDNLDPGYGAFVIWIEEPNGERRRFRSPRHYCEHPYRVRIEKGRAFQRDISIFGESGGYCFRRAGTHRVWITYSLTPRRVLRSNVLEMKVLPWRKGAFVEAARPILADPDLAQLLYYRLPNPRRLRKRRKLAELCEAFPQHPSVALAHYGLGRALGVLTEDLRAAGAPATRVFKEAELHLRKAVSLKALGDHRRAHAERALSRAMRTD